MRTLEPMEYQQTAVLQALLACFGQTALPPELKFFAALQSRGQRRKEPDMRIKLLITVLSLAAAFALVALVPAALAQTTPPAAAEKPAAPMKPRAAPAEEVASKNVSVAEKAQKCLKIEDETIDRWRATP